MLWIEEGPTTVEWYLPQTLLPVPGVSLRPFKVKSGLLSRSNSKQPK